MNYRDLLDRYLVLGQLILSVPLSAEAAEARAERIRIDQTLKYVPAALRT